MSQLCISVELAGYFFSVLIGLTLGVLGGGGSILTIPVLVYFFRVDPVLAGAYSLFVVGASSLFGVVSKMKQKLVDLRAAAVFGIPSLITVLITRHYVLPAIPEELFKLGGIIVTRSVLMMLAFAFLMISASRSMITGPSFSPQSGSEVKAGLMELSWQGALIGVVTGFLGAGGGFLIIPVLVIFSRLPMNMAVGTSLVIIAANSFIGFFGSLTANAGQVDWTLLAIITGLSALGIVFGNRISRSIDSRRLRGVFGWFILLMGVFIIFTEILPYLN